MKTSVDIKGKLYYMEQIPAYLEEQSEYWKLKIEHLR